MAIYEIQFRRDPGENSFLACAELLEKCTGCRVLKETRFLRIFHIATLLSITYKEALEYVIRSDVVHGFMYKGDVFVHPDRFTRMYMKKVISRINTTWNEIPLSETIH